MQSHQEVAAELVLRVSLIGSPTERFPSWESWFAYQQWESNFVREQQTQQHSFLGGLWDQGSDILT